jgi:drug/metabolite transporter (DMT)-like permease
MLTAAGCFTAMSTMAKFAVSPENWTALALARAFFVFLFAFTIARLSRVKLVFLRPRTLWLRSLAGSVSMLCTFYAIPRMPLADAITLLNSFPLWVAVISGLLAIHLPRPSELVAVAVGVVGIGLIQPPTFAADWFPAAVAILASLTTSVAMLGLNRLQGVNTQAVVVHFSGVASVVMFAAFALDGFRAAEVLREPKTMAMLVGVAIAATAGQLCLTEAFRTGIAARVSVVGLAQVVFGVIVEWALTRRQFPLTTLAGIAMVVIPCVWVTLSRAASPTPIDPAKIPPPGE